MRSQWSSRFWRILACCAAVVLLVSACAEEAQDDFPAETIDAVPEESGDQAKDPGCDESNPTASLRPAEAILESTAPEIEQIRADGKLRVGVPEDTLLFGFPDQAGELQGFDVEIAGLVADALGVELDLVPVQTSERIPKLESEEVEMVVKTMTISCERWAQINFSTVYFDAEQKILVRKGSDVVNIEDFESDGENKPRVCAESGSTSIKNIGEFANVEAVAVGSIAQCLVLFQQGSVEAISTDDAILAGLAAQDPFAVVGGDGISDEPYGIGIKAGNDEFTQFVNEVLEQARVSGAWDAAYNEHLKEVLTPDTDVVAPVPSYR